MKQKTKKKVLVVSTITAVISFAILTGFWTGNDVVIAIVSLIFFLSLVLSGLIIVSLE